MNKNPSTFVFEAMARLNARLDSVDSEDLLALVSVDRLGKIVGLELAGAESVTEAHLEGPLRGFAAITAYLQKSELALASFDLDESLILQDAALAVASEDDIAALFLWGGILAGAIGGRQSGLSYVIESGTCPNDTENCPVNGFSDAVYALAVKSGERHGFNIPDLGVTERRFDTESVQDYIYERKSLSILKMMGSVFGEAPGGQPPNSFYSAGWGYLPTGEA